MNEKWSLRLPEMIVAPVPRLALSVDELAAVKGIGMRTVDRNRDSLTVARPKP
jgi:hypothetical protein